MTNLESNIIPINIIPIDEDEIKAGLRFTEWIVPFVEQSIITSCIIVTLKFTATNGKRYIEQLGIKIELPINSQRRDKEERQKEGIQRMIDTIRGYFTKRVGLRGHRGYFKFKEVKILKPGDLLEN